MEIRYDGGIVNGRRRILVQWDDRGPFMTLDDGGWVGETWSPTGTDLIRAGCECDGCVCEGIL